MSAKTRRRDTAPPAAPVRGLFLLAAALLAPLAVRAALMARLDLPWGGLDLRGLAADLAIGLAFAALLVAVRRAGRTVPLVLLAVYALAHYANFEHVRTLGAVARYAHLTEALDPAFLAGSAIHPTDPVLLATLVLATLALGHAGTRPLYPIRPGLAMGAAAGLALGAAALPLESVAMVWRQTNPLAENLRLGLARPAPVAAGLGPAQAAAAAAARTPDLGGAPQIALPQRGRNVLLVMLESASGIYLEPVRRATATPDPGIDLPRLARRAAGGRLYRRFVNLQRQTSRGEFAILCGRLPGLLTREPWMTRYASADEPPPGCLPGRLRELGYETVYLQAAPLGYMSKDRFLPRAGFARVHGTAWFHGRTPRRGPWGVDDLDFFEGALALVDSLERDGGPWFLTLLTVGTHHPFAVRGEDGEVRSGTAAEAFAQADRALDRFLDALGERGILDDTLVLVTSDESLGAEGGDDPVSLDLSRNRGLLLALGPGIAPAAIDDAFTQGDLALSVLDYLGAAPGPGAARTIAGRSVFRRYRTPRPLVFANTYQRTVDLLYPAGRLTRCDEAFLRCAAYAVPVGDPFGRPRRRTAPDLGAVALLRALAEASVGGADGEAGAREVVLAGSEPVPIEGAGREAYVLGGQHVAVPAHSPATLRLAVRVLGRDDDVRLRLALGDVAGRLYLGWTARELRGGDVVRIGLRLDPTRAERRLSLKVRTGKSTDRPASLRFEEARLVIGPRTGEGPVGPPSASGVTLEEAVLQRGGERIDLSARIRTAMTGIW